MSQQLKKCPACKLEKPFSEFHKNSREPNGINTYCKKCALEMGKKWRAISENREKCKKRAEVWRAENADRVIEGRLKRKYGITLSQYWQLSKAQGHKCAICQEPCVIKGKLSVDHCHDTSGVRGLLCDMCNIGIGNFKNDIVRLKSAITYLKGYHAKACCK